MQAHIQNVGPVAYLAASHLGGFFEGALADEPAEPAAVVAHACELLGVAPPPLEKFDAATLSAMAQSFWAENRGVWNGRIKQELGVTLAYPDYRAGLAALLAAEPQKTK